MSLNLLSRSINNKLLSKLKLPLLILLSVCSVLISSVDPKCNKIIKCASTQYTTQDENQCIFYHSDSPSSYNTTTIFDMFEYDKKKCKTGFECQKPTQNQNYTCLQKPSESNLIPGSVCTSGTQCASNECNNGLCSGKPINGTCANARGVANHNICNNGLYCARVENTTAFTCQPQKNEGDDCLDFFACKNNLVCSYLKCVKAFSLSVGAAADQDDACVTKKTFYSEQESKSFCAEMKLVDKNSTHCNYIYSFNNSTVPKTLETQCTQTEDKDSYCPLPSDAPEWKEMVSTLNTFINSKDFLNAHATYKDEFGNFDRSLNKKIEPVLQYPKFKGADECLIQLYLEAGFTRVGLLMIALALFGVLA